MTNFRYVLSVALAAATLAVVLIYVLGAPALLQTAQAEEGHNLFMSIFAPIIQAITGGHASMSQLHGGQASQSQTQGMQQGGLGIIGNNILGIPATPPAAGLAAVVVMGAIIFATAAFVVSWRRKSFTVSGLLAASGILLTILPLANMNYAIPGPIIGVAAGLAILGFGVAKGIRSPRAVTVAAT